MKTQRKLASSSAKSIGSRSHHAETPTTVERLLKMVEVTRVTGLCRTAIYNGMRDGTFVRSVLVGPRSIRFLESEIRAWIDQRVQQRDEKESVHA